MVLVIFLHNGSFNCQTINNRWSSYVSWSTAIDHWGQQLDFPNLSKPFKLSNVESHRISSAHQNRKHIENYGLSWCHDVFTGGSEDCCHDSLLMPLVPDSKVHGANIGPVWGRQDPGGPHVGPMNFAIWSDYNLQHDSSRFSD